MICVQLFMIVCDRQSNFLELDISQFFQTKKPDLSHTRRKLPPLKAFILIVSVSTKYTYTISVLRKITMGTKAREK